MDCDGYFMPSQRPSLRWRPERVSGMPVDLEKRCFALVMPSARFHENVSPGPNFMSEPYSLA